MSQFHFQLTTVSVAVWWVLSPTSAHAANYTQTVNLTHQSIAAGDTVVVNNQTGVQATGDSPARHPITLGGGKCNGQQIL